MPENGGADFYVTPAMSPGRGTITFLSHDLRMTQCRGTGRKIGIMRQKLHAAVPVVAICDRLYSCERINIRVVPVSMNLDPL